MFRISCVLVQAIVLIKLHLVYSIAISTTQKFIWNPNEKRKKKKKKVAIFAPIIMACKTHASSNPPLYFAHTFSCLSQIWSWWNIHSCHTNASLQSRVPYNCLLKEKRLHGSSSYPYWIKVILGPICNF